MPDISILDFMLKASMNKSLLQYLTRKRPAIVALSTISQCKKLGCTLEAFLSNVDNEQNARVGIVVDDILKRYVYLSSLRKVMTSAVFLYSTLIMNERFASTEDGLEYLEENNWLVPAVQSWKYNAAAGRKYVADSEDALASALCNYWAVDSTLNTVPIPVDAKDLCENAQKGIFNGIPHLLLNLYVFYSYLSYPFHFCRRRGFGGLFTAPMEYRGESRASKFR